MGITVEMITFDCADPEPLGRWWAQAADGELHTIAPGEFVVLDRPDGPNLGFQRVPDPTPGKNRIHLDFAAADMDAEVARLVELGAVETGRHNVGAAFRWVVLADPAGNAFCIVGK